MEGTVMGGTSARADFFNKEEGRERLWRKEDESDTCSRVGEGEGEGEGEGVTEGVETEIKGEER